MTLEIIGVGFGRTGTLSLKHALEELGFEKCHHMMEVGGNAAQTINVSANSGDIQVTQMVMNYGGSSYIYNTSAGWIRNSANGAASLDSLRINDGGQTIRLDEFNFSYDEDPPDDEPSMKGRSRS